jgi:hypothetical protein
MKLCLKLLAVAVIAVSTYSLTGCSAPSTFSYKNVTVSISSFCTDCVAGATTNGGTTYNPAYPQPPNPGSVILMPNTGQGGTTTFVANVTNAPQTNVTWTLYPTPNLGDIDTAPSGTSLPVGESGNPLGTINAASNNTISYTVPGPPIYSGAALVQANQLGIPQGDVLLVASVPISPSDPSVVATQSQLIEVYGGSSAIGPPSTFLIPKTILTPAGQTQPVVTVPRNTSYAFVGGTVGAGPCANTTSYPCVDAAGNKLVTGTPDNTSIWEVGPAPFSLTTAVVCSTNGPLCPYGTVTQQGVYTAPSVVPNSTNAFTTIAGEVVVVVISHAAPTTATYAYVLIN